MRLTLVGMVSLSVLLPGGAEAAGHEIEIQRFSVVAKQAKAVGRAELAAAAESCAAALKKDAPAELKCIDDVKSKATDVLQAATEASSAGRLDDARNWCQVAQAADPTTKCADINTRWVNRRKDLLKLEGIRAKLKAGKIADADTAMGTFGSDFPDVLNLAIALCKEIEKAKLPKDVQIGQAYLEKKLPDKAQPKCESALTTDPTSQEALDCVAEVTKQQQVLADQKPLLTVKVAEGQFADGDRAGAVTTLKTLLTDPKVSPAVRDGAQKALAKYTGRGAAFQDAMRSPWIMQFLAAMLIVVALWIVPHILRFLWRKIYGKSWGRRRRVKWAFTGVQDDDKIGAADAVLDALRRVPNEIAQPIWTPGRLLLHAANGTCEVWEDVGITDEARPPNLHETVLKGLQLNQGRLADNALADAFQSLQFNVGSASLPIVARFWRALLDWWHDGQPFFSGVGQEDTTTKSVVIRLTSGGGPYPTVSVLATTKREDGVDAVALSAARAAYKLLSRMASNPESVEQIDGHAAFRQGAKIVACHSRSHSTSDSDADQQARKAELNRAVDNLEFARQVFCHDPDHLVFYLEALRFEAIALVLSGREAGAIARLEELEDRASGQEDARSKLLELEAMYNQAVLHMKRAASSASAAADVQIAATLFREVESMATTGDPLAITAAARRATILSLLSRAAWSQVSQAECLERLRHGRELIDALDQLCATAKGDDRRAYSVLANEARRDFAVAGLRTIAAFELPDRGPFVSTPVTIPDTISEKVKKYLALLERCDAFGSTAVVPMVCRAYGLLLSRNWRGAEAYARQALFLEKTCEFACYVAAEACLQRGDAAAARKCLADFAPTPITDMALVLLSQALAAVPVVAATAQVSVAPIPVPAAPVGAAN